MSAAYYHGGKAGLDVGDLLVPSDPHMEDGCPVCVARAEGRALTIGEFRAWALTMGEPGRRLFQSLRGLPSSGIVDPPTAESRVYITTNRDYATWYAARSRGDLYLVEPIGPLEHSEEDHFTTFKVGSARILEIVRRGIYLDRRDRRRIERLWKKADKRAAAVTA